MELTQCSSWENLSALNIGAYSSRDLKGRRATSISCWQKHLLQKCYFLLPDFELLPLLQKLPPDSLAQASASCVRLTKDRNQAHCPLYGLVLYRRVDHCIQGGLTSLSHLVMFPSWLRWGASPFLHRSDVTSTKSTSGRENLLCRSMIWCCTFLARP